MRRGRPKGSTQAANSSLPTIRSRSFDEIQLCVSSCEMRKEYFVTFDGSREQFFRAEWNSSPKITIDIAGPLVLGSFLKHSRHFDTAAGVVKKLRTGKPGVGRFPQSPRKPFANISSTAAFEGSSIRNRRFPSIVCGVRNSGSYRYSCRESPRPEINSHYRNLCRTFKISFTMNTPFAPNNEN